MRILEQYKKQAIGAYRNVSFDPEKRGNSIITDYSEELTNDLKLMEGENNYKEKYISYLTKWLSAQSRCFSTMITGPANVNLRQHEKANNSESKRYEEFRSWRTNYLKAVERSKKKNRTTDEVSNEAFEINRKNIISSAQVIKDIDSGVDRTYNRRLFVSSIIKNVETAAKNGDTVRVNKCLDLIKSIQSESGFLKPIVTENHSIWKLGTVAEANREKKQDALTGENETIDFDGGKIVKNYQNDRLQIFHDSRPDQSIINALKSHAFNWSGFLKCWQRKLTHDAECRAKQILSIN